MEGITIGQKIGFVCVIAFVVVLCLTPFVFHSESTQTESSNIDRGFEDIQRVYSKEQPFAQCRNWIKANLPNMELVEVSSTAEAARIASEEPNAGAIASTKAAETYGLDILVKGIEDAAHNFTRFFVLGRQLASPTGNDKTSILCAIKDRPITNRTRLRRRTRKVPAAMRTPTRTGSTMCIRTTPLRRAG